MSQKDKILRILKQVGSQGIHSFDLVQRANTFRVAARILDLKQEGYVISSMTEDKNGVRGVRYMLITKELPDKEWVFEQGQARQVEVRPRQGVLI